MQFTPIHAWPSKSFISIFDIIKHVYSTSKGVVEGWNPDNICDLQAKVTEFDYLNEYLISPERDFPIYHFKNIFFFNFFCY